MEKEAYKPRIFRDSNFPFAPTPSGVPARGRLVHRLLVRWGPVFGDFHTLSGYRETAVDARSTCKDVRRGGAGCFDVTDAQVSSAFNVFADLRIRKDEPISDRKAGILFCL